MKKMLIILLLLCFVLPTAQAAEGEKVLRVPADVSFVSEEDETAFRAAIEAAFAQRQPDVQIQWVEAHGDTDVIAAGSGLYTVEVNGERTNSLAVLEPLLFNLAEDEEIAANLAHFVGLSAVYGDGEGAVYYLPWSVTQSRGASGTAVGNDGRPAWRGTDDRPGMGRPRRGMALGGLFRPVRPA